MAATLVLTCCAIPAGALLSRGWNTVPGAARSDFEFYFLPQLAFLTRSLAGGFVPYWNAHLFSGYPVLEIQQSALFYPFRTVLLATATPESALMLLCLTAAVLAPVICYGAMRAFLDLPPLASAVGCCVFSLGGFVALRYHAGHLNYLSSIIWMPVAVLALARMDARRPSRHIAMAAAGLALMLLGGAPQAVVVTVWAQIAAWLAIAQRGTWRRRLTALCASWALAALISAPQWLPTAAYLGHAQRAAMSGQWHTEPPAALVAALEFALRYPLGDGMARPHLQQRGVWDTSAYGGAFGLLLALTALGLLATRSGRSDHRLRLGAALFALGWYLSFSGYLPGFAPFREPLKSLCLVSFAGAVLAAVGFERVWNRRADSPEARRFGVFAGCVILFAAVSLATSALMSPATIAQWALYLSEAELAAHATVEALRAEIARDPSAITDPVMSAALWLGGFSLAFVLLLRNAQRLPSLCATLLAVGLVADLTTAHWMSWVPGIGPGETGWPEDTQIELTSRLDEARREGSEWRIYLPAAMSNSAQRLENLAEPHGYDPLMPRLAIARSYSSLNLLQPEHQRALKMRALGVRYTLEEIPPIQPEEVSQRTRRYRLRQTAPAARVATLTTGVIVTDGRFEFGPLDGVHDWIEPEDRELVAPDLILSATPETQGPTDTSGRVRRIYGRNPNRLIYDVETSTPALLIVRHTWLPGWNVRRDGEAPASPLRVNGWMMGVPVQPNTRTVVFDYRPVGLRAGMWIALLGCVAALYFLRGSRQPADSA